MTIHLMLSKNERPYFLLIPLNSLHPASLAFLLFIDDATHNAASGPLHWLCSLSGMLLHQIYIWLTPLLHFLLTCAHMSVLCLDSMGSWLWDSVWQAGCLLAGTLGINRGEREGKEAGIRRGGRWSVTRSKVSLTWSQSELWSWNGLSELSSIRPKWPILYVSLIDLDWPWER